MNALRQPEMIWACDNCTVLLHQIAEIASEIKNLKTSVAEIRQKLDEILSK